MKKTALFLTALWMAALIPAAGAQHLSEALETHITRMMSYEQIPGLALAVHEADGSVWFQNFGQMGLDDERPVTEHSLFEIGSVTKTFTGSLFLLLMEAHGFDGETSVNSLLEGSGLQLPDQESAPITLNHLMTHTSGLPRLPGNMTPADDRDPYKDYSTEQLKAYAAAVQPQRAPGEDWEYSNFTFMVLGFLAAYLENRDFDQLIREHLTEPLGMTRTLREVPEALQPDVAGGSMFGAYAPAWHFDELRGLGELRSTSADLIRYLEAHLGTDSFARSAALQAGHQPRYSLSDELHMGFSWFIRDLNENAGRLIYHGGGTGGFRSAIAFDPASGRAAVALTNSNSDVQDLALHLANPAAPLRELPEDGALPEALIAQLSGLYQNPNLPVFELFGQNGRLMGQMDGQPALPLEQVEGLSFRNQAVGARMEFEASGQEPATGFVLHQGGMQFPFERITERPTGPVAIALSPEVLAEYAGTYHAGGGLSFQIEAAEGHLSARLTGQPAAKVLPEGNDRFFYEVVPAALQFERNDEGRITAVTLLQHGQEIRFQREP
ncbi:CubicO group peptidase, beta-lactamase class C family [Cyclonatronum proteinivorum]|uniref:CubicO group peptidase, beta-lactamase class C family n=1 Tax=Cyclonatronum proteinivorum TaxID=1457365 RepID=A0A345ULT4_9BACT|nr:serine hydrolase [Cyclonatronum proteinivorum]AXJ01436.1 CubicO group peptidase, beta-lactamase class C family [Cyclonatronum proteinivorum]